MVIDSLPKHNGNMKKILLLSDTHGFLDDKIVSHCDWADEIWHAGDIGNVEVADKLEKLKPIRAVYGNIDGKDLRLIYPLDNRFNINGLDVWITHIGGYPGHYDRRVRQILEISPPQLFICGHSHILKVMRDEKHHNMLMINPGAAGVQGFHKMKTVLRFTLNNGKVENLEAVELGKRGKIG